MKLIVPLREGTGKDHGREILWAEDLGGGRYRIRSVPFFAYGLSFEDIVSAEIRAGEVVLSELILRSGHSTYRIFLDQGVSEKTFIAIWKALEAAGCTYERATQRLLAVDVPPGAEILQVYRMLEDGETRRIWHFEEGHCGHPVSNDR